MRFSSGAAIADTSVFVALEQKRALAARVPEALLVSVITVAELRLGVLAASDSAVRSQRLATLTRVLTFEPLPIDDQVAERWAELRVALRDRGRRMPVNDSWIAATALAHGLVVATQDRDYDGVPGLDVVHL